MSSSTEPPSAPAAGGAPVEQVPEGRTFILVSDKFDNQHERNAALGFVNTPGERLAYLISFPKADHAFTCTNPDYISVGMMLLVAHFTIEGEHVGTQPNFRSAGDLITMELTLCEIYHVCRESACGFEVPELRDEDHGEIVTLTMCSWETSRQLFAQKEEEFHQMSGLGHAGFIQSMAGQSLTEEVSVVRGVV